MRKNYEHFLQTEEEFLPLQLPNMLKKFSLLNYL